MAHANLLAATLTVVFEGLLAFLGGPSGQNLKTHVAIVNAAGHTPMIVIDGEEIELLQDDVVAFGSAGTARTSDVFNKRVPTLSDYIHKGDVHDKVKLGEKHAPVRAYVILPNLPEAELTAEGSLAHPARFTEKNGTKRVRCPARMVILTANAPTTITITITGPKRPKPMKLTVDSSDRIEISNRTRVLGNHYKMFGKLLVINGVLGDVREITPLNCDDDGNVVDPARLTALQRFSSGFAASFSRVFFYPNGDCGATDYP